MKKIAIGTENFKEIIDENYFYIDKTQFIEEISTDKVSLFTRPRRFGKTLNMSMLYYFFSNKEKENAYLFNNLKISQNKQMLKHQNQYPVIFMTLKNMRDMHFDNAINAFRNIIQDVLIKNKEIFDKDLIDSLCYDKLSTLYNGTPSLSDLKDSIRLISQCMELYYQQKVIILIDEYDVPLQAAYQYGYYDEMVDFIGGLFGSVFKTNDSLLKGVMTGCLRIAKESIFTGLNNFKVYSIFDDIADDCFGFTQDEIDQVLTYYDLIDKKEIIKEWYDGYLFGQKEIYNPWSTLYYINNLLYNRNREPESYWANTSGNNIVYDYIKNRNHEMKHEFEQLVQGHTITKKLKPELTYREMDNIDNIYSFLLFTGYLKIHKYLGNDVYELIIPNKEVYKIYDNHFIDYFSEYVRDKKKEFVNALIDENVDKANLLLNEILFESISFYDNYESFYYGFLVGILSGNHQVESNKESGLGRFDIALKPYNIFHKCVVIECKKTDNPLYIEEDAMFGAQQVVEKKYIEGLKQQGYRNVIGYSIAFYQKSCYIVKV